LLTLLVPGDEFVGELFFGFGFKKLYLLLLSLPGVALAAAPVATAAAGTTVAADGGGNIVGLGGLGLDNLELRISYTKFISKIIKFSDINYI
jgi:hypothetical protein